MTPEESFERTWVFWQKQTATNASKNTSPNKSDLQFGRCSTRTFLSKYLGPLHGKTQTNNKKQISQISSAPRSRRFPSSPDSGTQSCQKSNGQSGDPNDKNWENPRKTHLLGHQLDMNVSKAQKSLWDFGLKFLCIKFWKARLLEDLGQQHPASGLLLNPLSRHLDLCCFRNGYPGLGKPLSVFL